MISFRSWLEVAIIARLIFVKGIGRYPWKKTLRTAQHLWVPGVYSDSTSCHFPANTQTLGQTLAQRHSIHWGKGCSITLGQNWNETRAQRSANDVGPTYRNYINILHCFNVVSTLFQRCYNVFMIYMYLILPPFGGRYHTLSLPLLPLASSFSSLYALPFPHCFRLSGSPSTRGLSVVIRLWYGYRTQQEERLYGLSLVW